MTDAYAIADEFCAAIEARSPERMNAIYDDAVVIWNNASQQNMSKAENVAVMSQLFQVANYLEYSKRRRHKIENGFVQMHCLIGTFTDGTPIPPLEACIIVETRDGRITRIDEYFDLSVYAPVFERFAQLENT